jgi:tRNA threonylcarbamoyladenosine biosynthesis protein TsaE
MDVDAEGFTFVSHSPVQTQRVGSVLGRLLDGHELVCLEGELGTGKTTLIQAVGRAQGVTAPITSPTFTLVNEYQGRKGRIYHVDLYRLSSPEEIVQAGIDSYFYGEGICLLEWAEKAHAVLPVEFLYLILAHDGDDRRRVAVKARGDPYRVLLEGLRRELES